MNEELKLKFGGCICEYNDSGKLTHITDSNIYGAKTNFYLEYDNKGRLIKKISGESVSQKITTYEYDDNDRLIREVESKQGYHDIEVTYEYIGDVIIKTFKHDMYTTIKQTDSHGNIVYDKTVYNHDKYTNRDWNTICIIRTFNYYDNIFIEETFYGNDETMENTVCTDKRKYSFNDDGFTLLENLM